MKKVFEFLINQEWSFWSRGMLIFLLVSIVIVYLLHSKFKLQLKSNLITSSILGLLIVIATYSVGFNCYEGYNAPKNKTVLIDLDKGFQEGILNVLNIKYEIKK